MKISSRASGVRRPASVTTRIPRRTAESERDRTTTVRPVDWTSDARESPRISRISRLRPSSDGRSTRTTHSPRVGHHSNRGQQAGTQLVEALGIQRVEVPWALLGGKPRHVGDEQATLRRPGTAAAVKGSR